MGKSLMDSNAVIYFLLGSLPDSANQNIDDKIDNNQIAISDVTKMEILGFNFTNPNEEQSFINFVNAIEVIPISQDIVNQTITFRKMKKIKLPDAIIGSTAFVNKYDMITRNMSDFKGLGITCINPFNDL
jgi:toxin FitB